MHLGMWLLTAMLGASSELNTPALHSVDYGELLDTGGSDVQLWWCDAPRKISRSRPVPSTISPAIRLQAAGNEFEAAQLVVRPRKPLSGLKATVEDLRGPAGSIAASNIQVLRVRYVPVRVPTDSTGVAGEWPDPLPPLDKPIDVPADVNQPLWVLIHVPESAAGGDYEGRIRLNAGDWSALAPVRLHVWGFALPKQPYTQSALGLGMGNVWRYQGLTEETQRRAVWAKYMQCFADHRISPYDPTPFDPYQVKPVPNANPPKVEINWTRFDPAMQEAIDRWHITSFNLRIPGMGGGTYEARHEGEIAGFKAGTPQHEAMFASAARQIEEHLRQKGWLDKGYIYWFDEPEPRDYDFVRNGMERLKKYAPGLCRMLTEQPTEPLFGAVDLWCPVSPAYDHPIAETRREKGERFWWYVCCGPKAPFCTLFIDHPAIEMRAWLWQTWQRKISGILIWETTYWTSDAAFPGSLQNPYEDPMSYVAGVAKPAEKRSYWGNGDGRFVYPPEAAAAGSKTPILDGPVSCIRWEMLRDGIEDLDYLHILDRAIRENRAGVDERVLAEARSLLSVPPEITKSVKEFATEPGPILQRREAVARMIEQLVPPRKQN